MTHKKASFKDFIGIFPNVLNNNFCDHLIEKFDQSASKGPGLTGYGIDVKKKNSIDITISNEQDWQQEQQQILHLSFEALQLYFKKYHFLLLGALSPNVIDPETGHAKVLNHDNFEKLGHHYLKDLIPTMYRTGTINLQQYPVKIGGYPHWHSEIYPQNESCETLHRTLLYMFYLNDVEEGGETEFYYQNQKIKPRKGTMVIAPAGFTHTHRGLAPQSNDKYILTSWIMFQRAEQLYTKNNE